MGPWEALGSQATFDRVLYDGGEFGHAGEVHVGSEEEMDFLGIPGLLEPDQVRDLLRTRQSERAAKQKASATTSRGDSVAEVSTHEQLAMLRRERSEEHTSELQSLMRISYAVLCLKKKNIIKG